MKYEVIARRYRPRTFEEVVGQESTAQTLRGAIIQGRLAHAYLFAGPRGVGKTSMARIFAKALNCPRAAERSGERETWARPCNDCSTCSSIHLGQDIDVIELDGASHRGIDDIRAIIEGINRPATRSPYKIYIIDEVHMLTREAFNALLKTLEEPPGHVKFVFATTEAHKIPETILSRCQRFDFHPVGDEAIVRRLRQICELEKREPENGLLEKIARYGKGGLRDAQTLLDQLMTFSEEALCLEDLDRITGRVPEATIASLVEGLLARRTSEVLSRARECFRTGADPAVLLEQVLETIHSRLRDVVTAEEKQRRATLAGPATTGQEESPGALDRILGCLQILLETASRLRASAYPEVAVEVALLKVARLEDPRDFERVLERLREMERHGEKQRPQTVRGAGAVASRTQRSTAQAGPSPEPARVASAPAEGRASTAADPVPTVRGGAETDPAVGGTTAPDVDTRSAPPKGPCDFQALRSLWDQISIEIQERHPDIAPYLKDVTLVEPGPSGRQGEPVGTFTLSFENEFFQRQMGLSRRRQTLEDVVRELTGAPWRASLELRVAPPPGAAEPPAGPEPERTPRKQKKEEPGVSEHPLVKKSIELFDGRLM